MRIAYLCHRVPYPPDKGEKIRAFHQLRGMARRHEVDLFTLADSESDTSHAPTLAGYCRNVTIVPIRPAVQKLRSLLYLLTSSALTIPYFHSAELQAAVRGAFEKAPYDRVFVYCSAMFQYVPSTSDTPVVTDLVDVDSDKWRQYAEHARFPFSAVYRREARRLGAYERLVCRRSARVIVTTDREAQLVREMDPGAAVHVIGVGVDTEFFRPVGEADSGPPAVVFTGDMSYFPNEEAVRFFAHRVLPVIRQSVPETRFLIVGRNPGRGVLELEQVPGVEVTGYVPDIRRYLAQAHVAVAPFSIAAGIQNKILEAMAYALPVVSTPIAVQGLVPEAAALIETAATAASFAEKTVAFLRNPELARRRGMECRQCVGHHYAWDACLAQLLELIEQPKTQSV